MNRIRFSKRKADFRRSHRRRRRRSHPRYRHDYYRRHRLFES